MKPMSREQLKARQEDALSVLYFHVQVGGRIPESVINCCAELGVAMITIEGNQQRIEIDEEFDAAWKELENGANEAELEDMKTEGGVH